MAFKLLQGNIDNLTGNCVVFWKINGDNVFSPGSKIIAANFTISALPLDDKLLTATFPPIAFEDEDTLFEKTSNISCDIVEAGNMEFPKKESEFRRFYKKQFYKYNKIIQEYSEKFKDKFEFKPEMFTEKQSLYTLRKTLRKLRKTVAETAEIEVTSKNYKVKKLIDNIKKYDKYDVQNIYKIMYQPGKIIDELTELYVSKYLSIYEEDYEKADELTQKILELEKRISSKQ